MPVVTNRLEVLTEEIEATIPDERDTEQNQAMNNRSLPPEHPSTEEMAPYNEITGSVSWHLQLVSERELLPQKRSTINP